MAQRVRVELVDDLDPSVDADETVSFALDGKSYEIDLSAANAAALRETLAHYVGAARKAGGPRRTGGRASVTQLGPSAREIRDWARSNGQDVPDRGRIPESVRQAYDAAH